MRMAIISGVHGNLPALEAVLTDIKGRGADFTVNLGDCVSTVGRASDWRASKVSFGHKGLVRGNHDRWIEELPD